MTDATVTCSAAARALAERPIGSTGTQAGFMLIEWPLPWPRDVGDVEPLALVVAAARRLDLRVQLIAGARADRLSTVTLYRKPVGEDALFRAFARWTTSVPAGDIVGAALALLVDSSSGDAPDDPAIDLLVCTHGKRDRCCGSLGTTLYQELRQRSVPLGPTVRVWRTSHLGGHRFAPTALVLPSGTMWAFMNGELIAQAVGSASPTDALLRHYRGCAGLQSAAAQALEHAVIAQVGWDVTTSARRVEVDDTGGLRLTLTTSAGRTRQWTAEVSESGSIPAPKCGSSPDPGSDVVPQWSVDDLSEVAPTAFDCDELEATRQLHSRPRFDQSAGPVSRRRPVGVRSRRLGDQPE